MNEYITQECYCTTSGGGCGGYFTFPLNRHLNGIVQLICPNCKHKHRRCVRDGQITEEGRERGVVLENIRPTKASFRRKPITARLRDRLGNERDGAVIQSRDDVIAKQFLIDSIGEFHTE